MKQKQYCIKKKKKREGCNNEGACEKLRINYENQCLSFYVTIFFFFTGMKRYKSIHLLYISFRVYVFFILLLIREKGPQLSPVSTILNSASSLWLYIKNHQRSFKKILCQNVPYSTEYHECT